MIFIHFLLLPNGKHGNNTTKVLVFRMIPLRKKVKNGTSRKDASCGNTKWVRKGEHHGRHIASRRRHYTSHSAPRLMQALRVCRNRFCTAKQPNTVTAMRQREISVCISCVCVCIKCYCCIAISG